ncbi:hypothetical protein [Spirosoma flavus]
MVSQKWTDAGQKKRDGFNRFAHAEKYDFSVGSALIAVLVFAGRPRFGLDGPVSISGTYVSLITYVVADQPLNYWLSERPVQLALHPWPAYPDTVPTPKFSGSSHPALSNDNTTPNACS